jgi:hypothetical protein
MRLNISFIFLLTPVPLYSSSNTLQVATMANAVYGVWAKYRMQITGIAAKNFAHG